MMSEGQCIGIAIGIISMVVLGALCIGGVFIHINPYTGIEEYIQGEWVPIPPEDYTMEHAKDDLEDMLQLVIFTGCIMFALGLTFGTLLREDS